MDDIEMIDREAGHPPPHGVCVVQFSSMIIWISLVEEQGWLERELGGIRKI